MARRKMIRQDGDTKRHKSRCINYRKKDHYWTKIYGHCVGSAHCSYYEESTLIEEASVPSPVELDKTPFDGVRMVPLVEIHADKHKFKLPAQEKIDAVKQYYCKHGELDKPISVSCRGKKYELEDKYLRYYVAHQLGLKEVPIKISTEKKNKLEDKIRIAGTKVAHVKYGKGVIKAVSDKYVFIQFDSGKTIELDIKTCIDYKLLTVI